MSASVQSNTFVVSGNAVTKPLEALLPGILSQLGQEGVQKMLASMTSNLGLNAASAAAAAGGDDDDVPDLVENFEDASEK